MKMKNLIQEQTLKLHPKDAIDNALQEMGFYGDREPNEKQINRMLLNASLDFSNSNKMNIDKAKKIIEDYWYEDY